MVAPSRVRASTRAKSAASGPSPAIAATAVGIVPPAAQLRRDLVERVGNGGREPAGAAPAQSARTIAGMPTAVPAPAASAAWVPPKPRPSIAAMITAQPHVALACSTDTLMAAASSIERDPGGDRRGYANRATLEAKPVAYRALARGAHARRDTCDADHADSRGMHACHSRSRSTSGRRGGRVGGAPAPVPAFQRMTGGRRAGTQLGDGEQSPAPARATTDLHHCVDRGRRTARANGRQRERDAAEQRERLDAGERVGGAVRVHRRQRAVVTGVARLQHVERLAAAHLADDEAIRPHAQRGARRARAR